MYPTFTNNTINQDTVSVYSGNSTNTNNSSICHNGPSYKSRMIPRSNSTSDLFDVPSEVNSKTRKKFIGHMMSPELNRSSDRFMGSNASLASGDRSPNYVTSRLPPVQNLSTRPKLPLHHSSPYPQKTSRNHHHLNMYGHVAAKNLEHNGNQPPRQLRQERIRATKDQNPYSASINRLNPIMEGAHMGRPLTPYQLQRKQMKNSFQFPNGENFTPRSRLNSSLVLGMSGNTQEGNNLPRANSLVSEIKRKPASTHHILPRSQSMNSLGAKRDVQPPLLRTNTSPVASGSSRSSYNSMKEHTSNNSTDPSSEPSSNSSVTALSSLQNNHLKDKAVNQTTIDLNSATVTFHRNDNSGKSLKKIENSGAETLPGTSVKKPPKNSGSKFKVGAFFKRLFSSSSSSSLLSKKTRVNKDDCKQRKRKKVEKASNCLSDSSLPMTDIFMYPKENSEDVDPSLNVTLTEPTTDYNISIKDDLALSSCEDEEDDDDILMDTDLVFDSLLLKANEKSLLAVQKRRDSEMKLNEVKGQTKEEGTTEDKPPSFNDDDTKLDPQIDYDLISEFSKLGSILNRISTAGEPQKDVNPQLPQRSSKRPFINNKEMIKHFYQPTKDNNEFTNGLLKRLNQEWSEVHLGEFIAPEGGVDVSVDNKRHLRFSNSIYVNDTWSPFEYQRSDKKFIKNRRKMMQLENEGFVQDIKMELNEFKRNEMKVHQDSARFTHFFL